MMATTSATLLEGVRDLRDEDSWERFVSSYRPLILMYVRAMGTPAGEVQDICQMVIGKLVRRMPEFRYDRSKGSFRGYLRRVVRSQVAERVRAESKSVGAASGGAAIDGVASGDDTDDLWDVMWMRHHYAVAWARVRASSSAGYIKVFECLMRGMTSAQAGEVCGMSDSSVRSIKRRMESKIRQAISTQVSMESACVDTPPAGGERADDEA